MVSAIGVSMNELIESMMPIVGFSMNGMKL